MQDPGTQPPHQSNQQPEPPAWQAPPQAYAPQPPPGQMPPGQMPYGQAPYGQAPQVAPSNNKLAAGLCGILLGALGVHKFILGYNNEGIIMVCISVLTCGFASPIMSIIGLIEGILYLTKSDEEFMQTYVYNKKPWF